MTLIPEWRIGHRLARAREEAGLSVDQMAEALGVVRHTITNYERHDGGKRGIPRSVVIAYHVQTGVDLAWLETGEVPLSTKWPTATRRVVVALPQVAAEIPWAA
jgi:transcriptional regulator with XRE-family HTH domain